MEEEGGGIEILAGVWWLEPELYVNGFVVEWANMLPLIFFDGESNMAGSTFSLSQSSSYVEESWARLWEEVVAVVMLIWPLFMMLLLLFASVVEDLCVKAPARTG